ncbi:S41 family peptidase [Pedobacter sp. WC2501]|uniref:S41 family peptidase n=1 Tax=Pedobacter sp. WC2501 TaxID=3461400 RepID=UPI0040456C17
MAGNKIYQTLICIIISCSAFLSYGQTSNLNSHINHADRLRQDFIFFRSSIQNTYPSLNRYSDEKTMNAVFDSCYASISEKTTDLEFYKMLKNLMSKIKDGHLYCSLPPALENYRSERASFFPVKLRFIDGKAWVDSVAAPQIPAGSEIISINKQPINAVIPELFKYIVSDGNIQTKKYHILNNFFYFYYFIAFGETPYFDVDYKLKDGQIKSIKIKADLEKNIGKNENSDFHQPLLDFSIKSNQIALITIKSFEPSELKIDYSDFLKNTFKKIRDLNIKKLIIDLRGNGGGRDTYGSQLYSYLANKPFKYYRSLQTVTMKMNFDKFKSNVSSYNNLTPKMFKKVHDNQYQLTKEAHPNLEIIHPHQSYNGEVWFLIDGLSFSTTAEFCAIAYSNKRGKFIGEETGGTYDGNTSGVQSELVLPNTKMEISFGTVKYEMAVKTAKEIGRGIIPEYKIQSTSQDIINKNDVQLNFALQLAGQENN